MATTANTFDHRESARFRERAFYSTMSVVFLIVVFVGFSRTFFLRPYFQSQRLVPLLILHGSLFSSWIALFLIQTSLIAVKRTRLHRKLGVAGGVIAALMIIVGAFTGIVRAKLAPAVPGFSSPLVFLTIPLGDVLVFGILVAAALVYRNRIDIHKRLMVISTIALMPAAVARFPGAFFEQGGPLVFFGIPDLLILPLIIFDIVTRGRPHRATLLGGALLVISHVLRVPIGTSHAWLSFANWITQWS